MPYEISTDLSPSTTAIRVPLRRAAEMFGMGYTTIWEAVRRDHLPAIQLGTRWLVRPDDVEEYIQQFGVPNEAERERVAPASISAPRARRGGRERL